MESRSVIILAILINACQKIDAKLNVTPRDTEVKINDTTYMNCSTSLQANLIQWRRGKNYVYTGADILEPYNDGRFSIEINASTGVSNLVIRSVRPSDAGKYDCSEDERFGETGSAQLIVLDGDPICKSNMPSDGVIGPNSCGIEPEEVKLSCSITYHGNIPPVLQWKTSDDNQSTTDGRFKVTSINNEVTYTLTMKSTMALNNSSFVCETTRAPYKPYTCSSSAINILYVFSSDVTVDMPMNDEVSCFANTSQSCSYKWKWFSGDDVTTESDNQILKPKKVGMHRCEAACSLGNKSCIVESMNAKVHLVAVSATTVQNRMMLLALLLVPALGVIVVIIYFWRKRTTLPEKYKSDIGSAQTIKTEPAKYAKKVIYGLTILDNELFVVSERSSEVEVYNSIQLNFSRRWNLKELVDPLDIESCNSSKCLYIFDVKGYGQLNEILRVDPNGKLIKYWSTGDDYGNSLSITNESNVILTVPGKNKLIEYSPGGQLVREINLSLEGIQSPWHAVKLTNGDFVVSHGSGKHNLHRVCIVDEYGKLKNSFGGNPGYKMNCPSYLCVDGNGFVMVADRENSRILLLDSDLKFKREILSKEKHELRRPMRVLLDEANGRLFVADNELGNNGRILLFKLRA